jgi:hypothetical protein
MSSKPASCRASVLAKQGLHVRAGRNRVVHFIEQPNPQFWDDLKWFFWVHVCRSRFWRNRQVVVVEQVFCV